MPHPYWSLSILVVPSQSDTTQVRGAAEPLSLFDYTEGGNALKCVVALLRCTPTQILSKNKTKQTKS